MSRITLRSILAIVAVALVAAVPTAIAHRSSKAPKAVGTIVSYTDGTLVISSGGLPVTGKVTYRTEIRWDKSRGRHRGHDDHGRNGKASRRGSDDGPGHDLGDDHGGRHDKTQGGLPSSGGLPSQGGLPPASSGLTAGGIVTEAELKLTSRGPVWEKIRLARPAAPAPAPAP